MSVEATSDLALIPARLKNAIAASTTWQIVTGFPNDPDGVRSRIFMYGLPRDAETDPTHALCFLKNGDDIENNVLDPTLSEGSMVLIFKLPINRKFLRPDGDEFHVDYEDAYTDALNTIGAIRQEVLTLALNANTENGYLNVEQWTIENHGMPDPAFENNEYYFEFDSRLTFR